MTFQFVRKVFTVLNQIASLPAGDADAVVASELVLGAGGQGQVEQGRDEEVAARVCDEPQVSADGISELRCRVR